MYELVFKYLKDDQVDEEIMFRRSQWVELRFVGKVQRSRSQHDMRKNCVSELSETTASSTRLVLVDK